MTIKFLIKNIDNKIFDSLIILRFDEIKVAKGELYSGYVKLFKEKNDKLMSLLVNNDKL